MVKYFSSSSTLLIFVVVFSLSINIYGNETGRKTSTDGKREKNATKTSKEKLDDSDIDPPIGDFDNDERKEKDERKEEN